MCVCVWFTSGPGDWGSIPDRVIPRTQKMVPDATLLNIQHYKARVKGKVCVANEKGAFCHPHLQSPTYVCMCVCVCMYICIYI